MNASAARAYEHPDVPAALPRRGDLHAIAVPADPNGLAYDRGRGTLYLADGETGAVLGVTGGRRRRVATIDAAGIATDNRLGGLAVGAGGALYVARLGHGHAGAVLELDRGQIRALAGLDPCAWRLGVAYAASEHALYATQYYKRGAGPCDGSVVRIELATGAVATAVGGLVKPVGVAVLGAALVVSDARQRAVLCVDRRGGAPRMLATAIDRPDSIAACGADSVVVTTYQPETQLGSVRRLWLDGRSETIAHGAWEPRGVATDGIRVFVAARRASRVLVFAL